MMKNKFNYKAPVSIIMIAIIGLFTACKEEIIGPDTVPIRAEIKQVIINNSIYNVESVEKDRNDGVDSMIITIPQGTDVTMLEMDLIYSYFGEIDPIVEATTDLSSPKSYKVTSNVESRDYLIIAELVPPSMTSFMLTSPKEVVGKISGDSIILELQEGKDYSRIDFAAEYFGESIIPAMDQTLDLSVDTIIKVINKEFEHVYTIYINWYKVIEFTGFIYDGTVHPNETYPGVIESEDSAFITINDAEGTDLGGKAARFTNLEYSGNTGGSVYWDFGDMGLDDEPDEITIIMRGRGYLTNPDNHRYLEIVFYLADRRFQFWVTFDKGLDATGWGELQYENIAQGLDPFVWNTYRMTANAITGEVLLYLNENPDPLPEFMPLSMDNGRSPLQWKAGFGDGSGGNSYDGEYDYFIIETGGAYSPEDLPLSKILPQ